jgi:Peptidase propeptide and YPEB domain
VAKSVWTEALTTFEKTVKPIHHLIASTALVICLPASAAATTSNIDPSGVKQPKVTEATARASALAAVPNGKIQSAELENEKGAQVWSFDIEQPGTRTITEILVDGATGKIISKTHESPSEQAKEANAEKRLRSRTAETTPKR